MAWEEDSITRLEQQSCTSFADSIGSANGANGMNHLTSDLSSDDEKYEAFSLSASRRSSVDNSADNADKKDEDNAVDERQPWWRFGAAKEPQAVADDNICWGDDADSNSDSSEELQLQNKELSEAAGLSASPDVNERPSGWWQLQFRRKSTSERSSSTWNKSSHSLKSDDEQERDDDGDAELNDILFPRRGKAISSQKSFLRSRRISHESAQSTLKGSIISHDSKQSSLRGSVTSMSNASQFNASSNLTDQQEDVNQVLMRHSMNLNSIERALLADIVTPNENRWKKPIKNTLRLERMTSSIPEEDRSSESDNSHNSKKDKTVETMMETQMSPTSELPKPLDGESLSSADADSDGLYCTWSVPLEPQDRRNENIPDTLPTIRGWDTEAMLELKNGVSLSRTHVIDEVSSIASSEHSGKIVSSKGTGRLSYRRKGDSNKLSLVSTLSSWRGSTTSKSRLSLRAQTLLVDEYEEEEEDMLEEEMFAVTDANHSRVVKEAMKLMDSVNKSVVSMGMDAPFRNMDEICPPFKKLHKNILHQMKELGAASISDQEKLLRSCVQRTKLHQSKTKGFSGSFTSNTSELTGTSDAPSLDDRKAVAAFIMNRITSHETTSVAKSSPTESKTHTAYLPNFMYYQFIAADKDSIIKPTSLCSGTGITGGDQYLQPDMLNMFGMFGSYFVGAGHLFQDDSDSDDKPGRSVFYMEPIHEDESVETSSAKSSGLFNTDSDDELLISAQTLDTPGAQLSIELLESIISELKQGQMQEMPKYVMSPKEKRTTLDNSDLPSPRIDPSRNSRDVSGLPGMPALNESNLPDQSIINELKRGQRDVPSNVNETDGKKLEPRQMGYY